MDGIKKIWLDGKMIDAADAKFDALSHALHYGSGVFEGVRFYETADGPAIFRLEDHTKRLFYSASTIDLPISFSEKEINDATVETVAENKLSSGYIRPLAFFGEGKMGLRPAGARPRIFIAAWAWGKYLPDRPISVKISKFIRIHPKSLIADAKVTGHYVNSTLAASEAESLGYDEALLLDFAGNVAEGPGENFFLVKNGELHTPKKGTILMGITRDTIFQLAKDLGIKVVERDLSRDEIFDADECFFTGTAAEVTPIGKIDDREIADGKTGKITECLKKRYFEIVTGKNQKYQKWLTVVKK